MKLDSWKWFFTWEGRVPRRPYFLAGLFLTLLKYAIDSSVAARFGEKWHIWNYVLSSYDISAFGLGTRQPALYATLWAIAVSFFWIGIALTLRRLRDAGLPLWLVFLFFVPLLNLLMFLALSSLRGAAPEPSASAAGERNGEPRDHNAIIGVLLAVVLGLGLAAFGTRVLLLYGGGLFLGVPFLSGFVASWFLNLRRVRSASASVGMGVATPFLIGLGLIGFRFEGLGCLLMALPLALPFSVAGALVARSILARPKHPRTAPTYAACVVVLPIIMFAEHGANLEPQMHSVTTSITINAPVSVVWKNVISFPPLAPPKEWLFRAGVAYPTSGQIFGTGPGAVRHCHFSTGDFIEPITVWDENRLLAFDVAAEPMSMRELSPWQITPPHLEHNYMRSRHGQFRLVELDDRHTLLEGTTWYQDYFWPQFYWQMWSDAIVHRIHMRVLQHVKQQAELN